MNFPVTPKSSVFLRFRRSGWRRSSRFCPPLSLLLVSSWQNRWSLRRRPSSRRLISFASVVGYVKPAPEKQPRASPHRPFDLPLPHGLRGQNSSGRRSTPPRDSWVTSRRRLRANVFVSRHPAINMGKSNGRQALLKKSSADSVYPGFPLLLLCQPVLFVGGITFDILFS